MAHGVLSYKTDGQFLIIKASGKSTDPERLAFFAAIQSDPKVTDGASLIIDIREYAARLTQVELQDRVGGMLGALVTKIGPVCAVLIGDTSVRIGMGLQLVAGNMNFRVGVFHGEAAAKNWLAPGG